MSISYAIRLFFVVLSMSAVAQSLSAQQAAPAGSCLVPAGWCWPAVPGTYGQPCTCPTPDGTIQNGTIQ